MIVRTKYDPRHIPKSSRIWSQDLHQRELTGNEVGSYKTVYPIPDILDIPIYAQLQEMKYDIREVGPFEIDVEVAFVPWHHYSESTAYRVGLNYRDYIACMADRFGSSRRWLDYRAMMRPTRRVPAPEVKLSFTSVENKIRYYNTSGKVGVRDC
jgi:hypothetical protein